MSNFFIVMAQKEVSIRFDSNGIVGFALDKTFDEFSQLEKFELYSKKNELSSYSKLIPLYFLPQSFFTINTNKVTHFIIGIDNTFKVRFIFFSFSAREFDLEALLSAYFRKAKYQVIADSVNPENSYQMWFDYQQRFKIGLNKNIVPDDNEFITYQIKITSYSIQPDVYMPMISLK